MSAALNFENFIYLGPTSQKCHSSLSIIHFKFIIHSLFPSIIPISYLPKPINMTQPYNIHRSGQKAYKKARKRLNVTSSFMKKSTKYKSFPRHTLKSEWNADIVAQKQKSCLTTWDCFFFTLSVVCPIECMIEKEVSNIHSAFTIIEIFFAIDDDYVLFAYDVI